MSRNIIKTVLVLILILSSISIFAKDVNPKKMSEDTLIIQAIFDENNGDYEKSRSMYEALYDLTGKKEYLLQEAKNTLIQKADSEHSISNLMAWITKHPADRDAAIYRMLVALYIEQGSLSDAEDVADEYLTYDSTIDDMAAVAELKLELNKPKEAIEILQSAYKIEHDGDIALKIANIWEDGLSRPKESIRVLEEHVAAHDDEFIGTYFKLIELYAKAKNIDKVLHVYKKLYKKDPKKYFLQKIIEISLYKKDINGVISFLEDSNENEEILYTFYKEKNEYTKAINLTKVLYRKSNDPKWLAEEGMLYYEQSKKARKITPEVLIRMQNLLEDAISGGVNDAIYLNYYGYTLIDHDLDIDRGIELVRRALKSSPNNTYYLDSLAWGLYKKGQCQKAHLLMKAVIDKEGLKEEEIRTHWDLINSCNK